MLTDGVLQLPEKVVRLTERAVAAMQRSDDRLPPSWEPLARLLLRFEGVASSAFEQIRAPLEEVAAAEVTRLTVGPAAWIADNLAVVSAAVESARTGPLTVSTLLEWHRRLMDHATNPLDVELRGTFRDGAVWVGGNSPREAAYVGPPHELVGPLIDDLVRFANQETSDVVTQAAIVHAQFESIHPFSDGNGRLGRVLISWLLVRRLGLLVPPPFSVLVARDPGDYLSGLALYRLGEMSPWVSWFATTLERSASTASSLVSEIESLTTQWRQRAKSVSRRAVRGDATFWRVLEILPEYPIVSANLTKEKFAITNEAARQLLLRLESLAIVSPIEIRSGNPGRPERWWAATELFEIVSRSN